MEVITIDDFEYLNIIQKNLKNIPIWCDEEALKCYSKKELIKVCKKDNILAVFLIPLDNSGVRRKFRYFPYVSPILLQEKNNLQEKEILKVIFEYIFKKYDYTFIPLHPDFKNISSISSKGGFVEMRHTHVVDDILKLDDLNSKLRNHINHAKKEVDIVIDNDCSNFEFEYAIKGDEKEKINRTILVQNLVKNNKGILIKATKDGRVVAGLTVIYDNKWAYLLHSYQKEKIRGVVPYLILKAIEYVFERYKISSFDFEGSVIDDIDNFFASFNAKIVNYPYVIFAKEKEKFFQLIERSKNIEGRMDK